MTSTHGLKFWKKEHPSAAEEGQSRLGSSTASHKDKAAAAAAGAVSSKADTHHYHRHSQSAHRGHAKESIAKENNTKATEPSADENNDDDNEDEDLPSDHKVTRKRSMLLNLMLPPEPAPVDSQFSLPPIDMYNPNPTVVVPSAPISSLHSREPKKTVDTATSSWTATKSTTMVTEERELRTTVHLPWSWSWFGHGPKEKGAVSKEDKEQQRLKNGDKDTSESIIRSLTVTETKTETVSRTVQAKAWISKLGRSSDESNDVRQRRRPNGAGGAGGNQDPESAEGMSGGAVDVGQRDMVGGLPQGLQQQQQQQSQTLQQEIIHQEIHNKTRTVSLVSVNVSDIFGLGKCLEVILAMMKAHGQFLSRQPFWLQCVIMTWEGLMMFLILWGLLRIVGLAEIVVWGADDLVRGTLSTVRRVGHAVQLYFAYR